MNEAANEKLGKQEVNYLIFELCTEKELDSLISNHQDNLIRIPMDAAPEQYQKAMENIATVREQFGVDMYFKVGRYEERHEQIRIEFSKDHQPIFSGTYDDPLKMIDESSAQLNTYRAKESFEKLLTEMASNSAHKKSSTKKLKI